MSDTHALLRITNFHHALSGREGDYNYEIIFTASSKEALESWLPSLKKLPQEYKLPWGSVSNVTYEIIELPQDKSSPLDAKPFGLEEEVS